MQSRKQQNSNTITQNILFDAAGFIVDSNDHLFDTSSLSGTSLTKYFPFIDSILDVLQKLTPEEPALYFVKVESTYQELQGIYDYSFSKETNNGKLVIHWQIIDKTEDYTIQRNEQQIRQDNIITGHNNE